MPCKDNRQTRQEQQQQQSLSASPPVDAVALADYIRRWAVDDDWCLLRYARAHKLHVEKALAGVIATATWRFTEDIDSMRITEFASTFSRGTCMSAVRAIRSVARSSFIGSRPRRALASGPTRRCTGMSDVR